MFLYLQGKRKAVRSKHVTIIDTVKRRRAEPIETTQGIAL